MSDVPAKPPLQEARAALARAQQFLRAGMIASVGRELATIDARLAAVAAERGA